MGNKKKAVVLLGKNPKLSELIAWAEQNNMRVEVGLREKQSAQQSVHLTKSRWAQFWDKLSATFRR